MTRRKIRGPIFCPFCAGWAKGVRIPRKRSRWAEKESTIPAWRCPGCDIEFRIQIFRKKK